nr:MAG TPA: hypothetical protein [Caudoviricetes sp.]
MSRWTHGLISKDYRKNDKRLIEPTSLDNNNKLVGSLIFLKHLIVL